MQIINTHNLKTHNAYQYLFFNRSIETMFADVQFKGRTSIVTPTNSLCYMGGGFDRYLLQGLLLGTNITNYKYLENIIQDQQLRKHHGYLTPNSIHKIELESLFENDKEYKYQDTLAYKNWNLVEIIQLPTMVVPEPIHQVTNVFDSLWNLLHEIDKSHDRLTNLIIPGIGTGFGHLDEYESTKLMIFTFFIYNLQLTKNDRLNQLKKSALILFFFNKDYKLFKNQSDINELENNQIITNYGKQKNSNLKPNSIMEFDELFKYLSNKLSMTSSTKLGYTLGFIRCKENNKVLLLNRNKAPWMGKWNGVGGKLIPGESPLDCIIRETNEETGLFLNNFQSRGILTWKVSNDKDGDLIDYGGLYLYTVDISLEQYENYRTPLVFDKEGILDWKDWEWIIHEDNLGMVDNIKLLFKYLFQGNEDDKYEVTYHNHQLISFIAFPRI
ncbi:uncharacterized protein J8A68_005176 [[Candida] subhashii]|uniref:Nudix hydrolase domain-containing protein n=1 Tax=[Candida] subhashii TaxID=561895 RepID=A0A8J5QFW4_9ASCO|nr:uncharacterized protein J8A68_005176 [[Candida] subhashii]KAG7661284.1 hypothetical protein J8A68_005176 [[Candida] subhashii]